MYILCVLWCFSACVPPPVIVTTVPTLVLNAATATVPSVIGVQPTAVVELAAMPTLSAVETAVNAATATTVREYEVQAGDTLFGLAIAFDVPMAAMQLQNDLGIATTIKVGEVLVIPSSAAWEGASPFWVLYAVKEGDALSTIAVAYGLEVAQLQAVNGLSDVDLITVGQLLVLPLYSPAEVVQAEHRPTATLRPPNTATLLPPTLVSTLAAPLAATLSPAATATPVPVLPPVAPPPPADDMAALASAVFTHLNAQRTAHNLPPLAWNGTLARAAQLHAEDCYARGWCGHSGSDGSTMRSRIIRAGYDPVRWSECWARYGSAAGAVAVWMDEVPPNDPHRRTILSTWLTEVGVGVMPGNGQGYYFIADFGTPK